MEYFVETYGEVEGLKKYKEFNSRNFYAGHSKIADEFFEQIAFRFSDHTLHYNDTELDLITDNKRWCRPDYYDETFNIVIEFYGDYWHSEKFKEGKTHDDELRINDIIETLGCKVIIVWEKTYRDNEEKTINDVVNLIRRYYDMNTITVF